MTMTMDRVIRVAETLGEQVKRRREALGLSLRQLAAEASVDRARLTAIEKDDTSVQTITRSRVMTTLDRLERRYSVNEPESIVNVIELSDGTKITFTGSAEGVAEAAQKFLRDRTSD